jgi:Flp pilus assembly protein TadB
MMREEKQKEWRKKVKILITSVLLGALFSAAIYYFLRDIVPSAIFFGLFLLIFNAYFVLRARMAEADKIKKMEEVFPDFIELVASNLNAGMTIDKSLIMSSRKEFNPLDVQINLLGKDIITGKDITSALQEMGRRINSGKISKTIDLIVSSIHSGGNLSILLGEIAGNMREREFVEIRAASYVLMYVIFIFIAV